MDLLLEASTFTAEVDGEDYHSLDYSPSIFQITELNLARL